MKYRPLGKTRLQFSEISFGTGDNAGLMVLGSAGEQRDAVARALELGINYFDTSPDYGKGVAETNLGKVLGELRADALVSTKVEIMPDTIDDIEGAIVRSLDGSLRRLQRDYVDILMIHNPPRLERNPSAQYWIPLTPADMLGPALRALEKSRTEGKVRHFGFACEHAEPAAVYPLLESGHFILINAWYNLVNPTAGMPLPKGIELGPDYDDYGEIITRAHDAGVGTAAIRPLAGGALTRQVAATGPTARHRLAGGMYTRDPETFRPEADRGRAFGFLDRPDRSLPQAAYAFALMNPAVTTVVGGFSDISQMEELVQYAEALRLGDDEILRIRSVYAKNFGIA
ncbi:MAG TPA: aldo/keto reductase [Candidatus Acidoferrales bacterium]|nr:aldo/keto reductase [Candidatus Acidoferrales bacterium]